jgi:hypothetical protein
MAMDFIHGKLLWLNMANGDWPYLLVVLCGAILGGLAFWSVVRFVHSACGISAIGKNSAAAIKQDHASKGRQ